MPAHFCANRYFICFLYIFVLPSPTVYYYFADSKQLKATDEQEFGNPLAADTDDSTSSAGDGTTSKDTESAAE